MHVDTHILFISSSFACADNTLQDTFAVVQTVLHGDCAAVSEALADMTENESGLRVQMPYRTSMLLRFMCCFSLTLNRGQVCCTVLLTDATHMLIASMVG